MSALVDTARSILPEVTAAAPLELHATCATDEFEGIAAHLAGSARLADLYASSEGPTSTLNAVFADSGEPAWVVLRTAVRGHRFDSLTPRIHAASWYEREIKEMHGLEPAGHPAPVPLRLPGTEQPGIVHGQGVLEMPLGPVRSGPQEAAEFLFSSGGEDLVMVSVGLGWKFRDVERLAEGREPEDALTLAERLAGVSTFANALAFAQACERARGVEVPPRARWARSLLGELERLHHHFGTLSRVAEACGLVVPAAQLGVLREEVLRACAELTGHRYLRGVLTIGGLAFPLPERGLDALGKQAPRWARRSARIADLLGDTATYVDRLVGTAILTVPYAAQHNLVGPIGRASGADRDARRDHPYSRYGGLPFRVPVEDGGDAAARVAVLQAEVGESVSLLLGLLGTPEGGAVAAGPGEGGGAALGWAEAPGGEALHSVELDARGRVKRWRARPPAVVNWHPFAHACASGNNLTDFPVIEASFGLSLAEFDR